MDYNKIQTFITVAELGSITAAGRQLQRSQSAISQQIQSLEVELGLRLLERKGGKVLLSKDGEHIFQVAKERLNQIHDEVQSLKKNLNMAEGHIKIGILDDYAHQFELGGCLARLSSNHPQISFSISYGTSASLEQDLIDNRIDFGFLVFFTKSELFVRHGVASNKHNLYTSAAYLKKFGIVKTYADVIESHLLDLDENFITLTPWFKKNAPHLVTSLKHRKPNLSTPSHKTIMQIVSSGFGLAILPDYLMAKLVKEKKCQEVLPSSKSIKSGLDFTYRTNKTLRLCEKLFIKEIKSMAMLQE